MYNSFFSTLSPVAPHLGVFVAIIALWSLAWKGWALWLAARRHEKIWYIILLLVNTAGILEIIYIFAVAKQKDTKVVIEEKSKTESTETH